MQLPDIDFFAVLDDIPEICFVYRQDGVLVTMNRTCEAFTGVKRDLVIGNFNILENTTFLAEELVDGYMRAFAGEAVQVHESQVDLPRGDGTAMRKWVDTTLVPLQIGEDGKPAFVLGIQRDVTERAEARGEIESARREINFQRDTIASLEAARAEIEAQKETIEALSTPVIEVWDGIVTLPLLGTVTALRAKQMSEQLLDAVTQKHARYVILDLTGIAVIDTTTGQLLLRVVAAVKLLGATGVFAGIRPEIAQTLVGLEVELEGIRVYRNMREALRACISEQGHTAR